jgi:hypothetical protein
MREVKLCLVLVSDIAAGMSSLAVFFVFSCLRGYGIVETAEGEVQRT